MKIQSLTQLRILCIIHSTPEYLQHKEKTKRCLLQVAGAVADPKQFLKKKTFSKALWVHCEENCFKIVAVFRF